MSDARKDDSGKLRIDLIPPEVLIAKWKDIIWTDGKYSVSDVGKVKSNTTKTVLYEDRIWSGYIRVKIMGKNHLVHRLVLSAFSPIENQDSMFCNHINGVKTDNRLVNLEWVTKSQNTKHAFRIGLQVARQGSALYNARFTESDVREMRCLYSMGATQVAIAELYGTKQANIWGIFSGKDWRFA